MASARPAKRPRYSSKIVSVRVGEGELAETFNIHEPTLRESSKFFAAALDKRWKEGRSLKVVLPDDKPEIFAEYTEWLYEKKVSAEVALHESADDECDCGSRFERFAKMYVMGEKLQDDDFCNTVIEAIVKLTSGLPASKLICMPGPKAVVIIYGGTPSNSPARRCMVSLYKKFGLSSNWDEDNNYPSEFQVDLLRALLDARKINFGKYGRNNVEKAWLK